MRGCRASYDDGLRRMSVGHETKKVVSSADTSSVTIFILHQSPFRFAVTLLQWKRLLTMKSAYTGPPTYFHSSSTTGFPLAPIRGSAIFRARFLHASDDRLPRPRTYTHTMTDRHVSIFCDWSSLESAFQNDNYRARYGNACLRYLQNPSCPRKHFCFERESPIAFP